MNDRALQGLDKVSRTLLDRVRKELKRLEAGTAAGTERVGGWTKVGAATEELLLGIALFICQRENLDPAQEFSRSLPRFKPLDKATAGELFGFVRNLARTTAARLPEVAAICEDAEKGPGSVLDRAVRIRNTAAHEAREPAPKDARAALEAVAALLLRYRKAQGWSA